MVQIHSPPKLRDELIVYRTMPTLGHRAPWWEPAPKF